MRTRRPRLPLVRRVDAAHTQVAASLQRRCPLWLVVWSAWHRTYTGFACFTTEPTIIDEADATAFLTRADQIEKAGRGTQAA